MDGELRPPKLLCPWCEIDEGRDDPLFPHEHHDGQIPPTPCRACSVSNHDECDPRAPWWCVCDCGLKGETMVAVPADALNRFAQLRGTTEHPHGSNHVPGITDFLHTAGGATTGDSAWCCETVSRVLFDVGIHDLCNPAAFGGWVNGCAYVPYVTRHFRGGTQWLTPGNEQPGDLEIFAWGGAGSNPDGDHIGIVFAAGASGGTWEGNSAGPDGYDEVAQHHRGYQFTVGFVRPSYGHLQPPAPPRPAPIVPPKPAAGEPPFHHSLFLTSPHLMTGNDVVLWQRQMLRRGWQALGRADGVFGEKCAAVAGDFQDDCKAHGWKVGATDRIVGPLTWHASWARPVTR